jgi:hypothetical protein
MNEDSSSLAQPIEVFSFGAIVCSIACLLSITHQLGFDGRQHRFQLAHFGPRLSL